MATVEVTAQRLWQFGTYLNSEVWNDFHKVVRDQAGLQGCNKNGFSGLISAACCGGRSSGGVVVAASGSGWTE